MPPRQLFDHARSVLRQYGVDIVDDGGLLAFVAREKVAGQDATPSSLRASQGVTL